VRSNGRNVDETGGIPPADLRRSVVERLFRPVYPPEEKGVVTVRFGSDPKGAVRSAPDRCHRPAAISPRPIRGTDEAIGRSVIDRSVDRPEGIDRLAEGEPPGTDPGTEGAKATVGSGIERITLCEKIEDPCPFHPGEGGDFPIVRRETVKPRFRSDIDVTATGGDCEDPP